VFNLFFISVVRKTIYFCNEHPMSVYQLSDNFQKLLTQCINDKATIGGYRGTSFLQYHWIRGNVLVPFSLANFRPKNTAKVRVCPQLQGVSKFNICHAYLFFKFWGLVRAKATLLTPCWRCFFYFSNCYFQQVFELWDYKKISFQAGTIEFILHCK
jgi:hypothetical protein